MDSNHISFAATDRSYLAILKREIHTLAQQLEFSVTRLAEIDLIIAELTSNLIKHAAGGEILVRVFSDSYQTGIELLSIDNGSGMNDPLRMIEDGVSTTNTLGHGLGSIKRLADDFQIYSQLNWGTIVLVRIYQTRKQRLRFPLDIRTLIVPKPGETKCGDGIAVEMSSEKVRIFVGDGLGHGPDAALAVQKGIELFQQTTETSPSSILKSMHPYVKKTRGLVGTVAIFDYKTRNWQLCGVGNISTRLISPTYSKNHLSYNGIVGMNIPTTLNDQTIAIEPGQYMIFCSDGIKSRWDSFKYPMIGKYDLSILAAAIYKDYARKTDDMSILIARLN